MHYNKASQPAQQQQMGGCSPNMMMYMMPIMSLVISFTVPAGVAVYWIFSNLLQMVQTVVLNAMYNPAKIRAQAEAEYAERRRKKQEDKERLKAARLAEQAAWQKEENEKRAAKSGKKPATKKETTEDLPQEEPAAEQVEE
jgi:YidC/Oxa1 family membrane protein insertase